MHVEHGTLDRLVDRDYAKISRKIERFISSYVSKNSVKGVVVGLSGGLDSAVVLQLSVNALGPEKVFGIMMPSKATPKDDLDDAISHASALGVKYKVIDLEPIIRQYTEVLPEDRKARGNLMARIRMSILYYHAFVKGCIVAGTGDKSEYCIGYFTKHGDGGADIMPIAGLYKTQVRALGKHIGVPGEIINKKSSPRLWDNHLAEEEIGLEYEAIDSILHLMIDRKAKPKDIAKKLGIDAQHVARIKEMVDASAHKRKPAPIGPA